MPSGTRTPPIDLSRAVTSIFREKMHDQELNIAELGRKVGMPRSTLSNLINDKKLPLMSQVRNISIALGVPLPQLIIEAERRLSESESELGISEATFFAKD